jgi:hypothetical protein
MYLFLAVPNFCGSSLMHSVIQTSKSVVTLDPPAIIRGEPNQRLDFVEGNMCAKGGYKNLRGPHSIECNMEHVYNDPNNYNWDLIKEMWDDNWESKNPSAPIRMQKTPADCIRLKMMLSYFPNLKWLVSVRNPYTYVESIMRKATFFMEPIRQLDQICHHVTRMMELQKENVELLGPKAYVYTYEDFVNRPEYHVRKIIEWLPELESIDLNAELIVKGTKVDSIHNDGPEKFKSLVAEIPQIVEMINEYFAPKEDIIKYWGYNLMHSQSTAMALA